MKTPRAYSVSSAAIITRPTSMPPGWPRVDIYNFTDSFGYLSAGAAELPA
jgi:hypothetical protein